VLPDSRICNAADLIALFKSRIAIDLFVPVAKLYVVVLLFKYTPRFVSTLQVIAMAVALGLVTASRFCMCKSS
jgi:hypothetical protein